jgi:phosphoribosylglycinamide formyltransferase-1
MSKLNVLLLASGSGSLAQAIFDAVENNELNIKISALISDKECGAIEKAEKFSIPTHIVALTGEREKWNQEMLETVADYDPDLVVSVGFMRILSPGFVSIFKVINTHPALLPAFPGAHAVRDALAAGVSTTGSTVHWVDSGVDTGKVIEQRSVEIEPGESEEHLHERIKIVERRLIVETLLKFSQNHESGVGLDG